MSPHLATADPDTLVLTGGLQDPVVEPLRHAGVQLPPCSEALCGAGPVLLGAWFPPTVYSVYFLTTWNFTVLSVNRPQRMAIPSSTANMGVKTICANTMSQLIPRV